MKHEKIPGGLIVTETRARSVGGIVFTGLGSLILIFAAALHAFGAQTLNGRLLHVEFAVGKEIAVIAACVLGVFLIVTGTCALFLKKSRQEEIDEQDERTMAIANAAKSAGFEVMTCLYGVVIVVFGLSGAIGAPAFFVLAAVFAVGQAVFVIRLWYLQKTM